MDLQAHEEDILIFLLNRSKTPSEVARYLTSKGYKPEASLMSVMHALDKLQALGLITSKYSGPARHYRNFWTTQRGFFRAEEIKKQRKRAKTPS